MLAAFTQTCLCDTCPRLEVSSPLCQKILINPTCAQRHRDHSERTGEREMWGSPTSGSNQLGQRPMEADHLLLLGGSKMHSLHSSEA